MSWITERIEDIAHAWSVVWEKRGVPQRQVRRLKGAPPVEVEEDPVQAAIRARRERQRAAYGGQKISAFAATSDQRYIPRSGGIMGWFQNSGVMKVEQPNNYRLASALDEADVRTIQAEHARE